MDREANEIIVTCNCHDTPAFAQTAFSILFPDRTNPELVTKKELPQLIKQYQTTDFGNYLEALYHNKEKFSYYFCFSDAGEVLEQWDLQKGNRVN